MKKFIVVDYYEDCLGEVVFTADTISECEDFISEYEDETDGECACKIYES